MIREFSSTSVEISILKTLQFGLRGSDLYCGGHRGSLRSFSFREVKILPHLSQRRVDSCF